MAVVGDGKGWATLRRLVTDPTESEEKFRLTTVLFKYSGLKSRKPGQWLELVWGWGAPLCAGPSALIRARQALALWEVRGG